MDVAESMRERVINNVDYTEIISQITLVTRGHAVGVECEVV